ncbi:MAG: MmcQ/YjbR family DNA-binding protein [Nocardioides sp.]
MATADDVRRVLDPLPRSYEVFVRGRWKFRVKQIVYVAFSADEMSMGFGFPRTERDGLVASAPDTFFLPPTADLRFQWVCAHLAPLEHEEMRELVTDAWRMCTPKMLHELPELPDPMARIWDLVERQEWGEVRTLLHPQVELAEGGGVVRGRSQVLTHLREQPRPRPPTEVEVLDGRLHRWTRAVGHR